MLVGRSPDSAREAAKVQHFRELFIGFEKAVHVHEHANVHVKRRNVTKTVTENRDR